MSNEAYRSHNSLIIAPPATHTFLCVNTRTSRRCKVYARLDSQTKASGVSMTTFLAHQWLDAKPITVRQSVLRLYPPLCLTLSHNTRWLSSNSRIARRSSSVKTPYTYNVRRSSPCTDLRLLGHSTSLGPSASSLRLGLAALLAGTSSPARLGLAGHLLFVCVSFHMRKDRASAKTNENTQE